jgi:hypothetical protein
MEVLTAFRPLFTAPTWRKLMTLLVGTLLTRGRRTITAALRATGNEQAANFSLFHQTLNRASWSPLAVNRKLLVLSVQTFVPEGTTVDLVIDETLERRCVHIRPFKAANPAIPPTITYRTGEFVDYGASHDFAP